MKTGKLNKSVIFIFIFSVIFCTCACGIRDKTTQSYYTENEPEYIEKAAEKQEPLTNPIEGMQADGVSEKVETDAFTHEMAVAFIKEADNAIHEFMGDTQDAKNKVYSAEEIYGKLKEYFAESIIDYVLYVYQLKEGENGYTYTPYDEYDNYWIDTSKDMTKVSETEDVIEVGVTFKHVWQNGPDEESVPVRLEKIGGKWIITDISQWYNDFRYEYMPYISFDPPYFTEEMADGLIECFGTDEAGNRIVLSTDRKEYILSDSSERIISEEEVSELSKYELYLAAQEIYARHGKKFADPVLYWRFSEQIWYDPYHFVFSDEVLSEIEEENLKLIIEKGSLGKEAGINYGSLYPVTDTEEGAITEEEVSCMIYHAFEMADKVMAFDEKNLIEEESQDVIQVYSLGEYSDEEMLKRYLSDWFDEEIFDYLTVMYGTWTGLCKGDDGKYTISREGTYGGNAYVPYFFEKTVIKEADQEKLVVEMPFYYYGSMKTELGEIILEKRENKWLITSLSIPYYDELRRLF